MDEVKQEYYSFLEKQNKDRFKPIVSKPVIPSEKEMHKNDGECVVKYPHVKDRIEKIKNLCKFGRLMQLAVYCGLPENTISINIHRDYMPANTINKISAATGVDENWLKTGNGKPDKEKLTVPDTTLAERLQKAMDLRKEKPDTLGKKSGIIETTILSLLNGGVCTINTIKVIGNSLQVNYVWLYCGKGKMELDEPCEQNAEVKQIEAPKEPGRKEPEQDVEQPTTDGIMDFNINGDYPGNQAASLMTAISELCGLYGTGKVHLYVNLTR